MLEVGPKIRWISVHHTLRRPSCVSRTALVFLLSWVIAGPASAHTLPISYLQLVPAADHLHLELTFNPFELTFFSELDTNHDGRLDPSEWDSKQLIATERILDCLIIQVNDRPIKAAIAAISPDLDSHHATLRAHYAVDARQAALSLRSNLATLSSGSHFTQVTLRRDNGAQAARLDAHSSSVTFAAPFPAALAEPSQPQSNPAPDVARSTLNGPILGLIGLLGFVLATGWISFRWAWTSKRSRNIA